MLYTMDTEKCQMSLSSSIGNALILGRTCTLLRLRVILLKTAIRDHWLTKLKKTIISHDYTDFHIKYIENACTEDLPK